MTPYITSDGLPGVALAEWRTGTLPGVTMTSRDFRLAAQLRARSRDSFVDVQPAEGGVTVKTTGTVGLIRFTGFEVRINPKLPGNHLQLLRLVEFASGLSGLVPLAGSPRIHEAGDNLLDFVVALLSEATERILAGGLRADYVEHEGELAALRGRLLPDRQQLERFGLYDRVICRYDELEHDIPDNQLLARALACGAAMATLASVRVRARRIAGMLDDLCDARSLDTGLGPSAFSYSRHNEHYRSAHALSWLILQSKGPDEELATGRVQIRSFLIDMNELFEQFLEKTLLIALTQQPVKVVAQRSDSIFWRPDIRQRYARIRPDLLVQSTDRASARLPVDAKYKRYDWSRIDAGDLTQVFLYAYAYRDRPVAVSPPRALLVHPSEAPGEPRETRIQVRSVMERAIDAELTAVAIHIPTVLDEVDAGGGATLDALRDLAMGFLHLGAITPAAANP